MRVSAAGVLLLSVAAACEPRGESGAPTFLVAATIGVGAQPHGIRFSSSGDTAYVALSGEGAVAVVDLRTMRVVDRVTVGGTPLDLIGITPASWLVTDFRADSIAWHGTPRAALRVGAGPSMFAPSAVHNRIAIASEMVDTLSVIDLTSGSVVQRYGTQSRPYPPDVTMDGVLVFVPNRDANSVTVVDLLNDSVVTHVPVCARPQGGALTRDNVSYVVACSGTNQLFWINTASYRVVDSLTAGVHDQPFAVAMTLDGRYGLINNAGGNSVSVLDVEARRIVADLSVGKKPIAIRMHPDGRRAFVSSEDAGTVSVIELPPALPAASGSAKNEVVMLGMIHGDHRTSTRYGLDVLRETITQIKPDYVLTEIPPNRFDQAMESFKRTGHVQEARVERFPEYVDVLFPMTATMSFTIIPTAGWTAPMDAFRRTAMARISKDPTRAADWAEYQAAASKADSLVRTAGADDPHFINSDAYDEIQAIAHEPYNRLLNDDLGPGGWDNINIAHYGNIDRSLDKHRGEGKRFLITYGAGHKEWFMRELRKRTDIKLLNAQAFFSAEK